MLSQSETVGAGTPTVGSHEKYNGHGRYSPGSGKSPHLHLVPPMPRRTCTMRRGILIDVWAREVSMVETDDLPALLRYRIVEPAFRLANGDVCLVDDCGDVIGPAAPGFSLDRKWVYRRSGFITRFSPRLQGPRSTVAEVLAIVQWWDVDEVAIERRQCRAEGRVL